jgi:TonB family protein
MVTDTLFQICTLVAIALWLLLICAPRWRWTQRIVQSAIPFALLSLVYIWAQATDGEPPQGAGFTSLESITLLFSSERAMLAVWIHFIVVDLFVGAWMVRDARRNGIRHLWIVPSLIATFAVAPIGLASYLVIRAARRRSVELGSSEAVGGVVDPRPAMHNSLRRGLAIATLLIAGAGSLFAQSSTSAPTDGSWVPNGTVLEGEPSWDEFLAVDEMPTLDYDAFKASVVYPEEARKQDIEGTVLIHVLIGTDGAPLKYHVLQAAEPLLVEASLTAIKAARFTPAKLEGKAILCWVTIPVAFKLD